MGGAGAPAKNDCESFKEFEYNLFQIYKQVETGYFKDNLNNNTNKMDNSKSDE